MRTPLELCPLRLVSQALPFSIVLVGSIMEGLNPTPTVQVLHAANAIIGEGPFYEKESDSLLWVDIDKKTINFFDLKTSQNRALDFSETVGAVIPVEGCNQLVALLARKVCLLDRDSGDVIKVLASVQEDKPTNRFNDAKCDSSGRLWCGTMAQESAPGVLEHNQGWLYCYESPGPIKECVKTTLSNGMDWNEEDNVMYYIDTIPKYIYSFSYNWETGTISNQEPIIDYSQHSDLVYPDGMCRDTEGRLWVANFGGQCVTCWDPATGKRLMDVKIPGAKRITSCCFGGPNYEWLFVTSASYGAGEQELAECPNSGNLFVIKDLGARGVPAYKFKP